MKKGRIKKQTKRFPLTLLFALLSFFVLLVAILLAWGVIILLIRFHVFEGVSDEIRMSNIVIVMSVTSLVMGAGLAMIAGKIPLTPVNQLIDALNSLAAGNFKTRLSYKKPLANHPTIQEATESFNKLAKELENTEMLRSDFINNFSHEFKTPIVSIRGFAKELRQGNLDEEQQQEYAKIIEEESDRLAKLSINVLELSRLENQQIVTDRTAFFLDEQLRQSILLCEAAWSEKEIEMVPELDEVRYFGNEELLAHIWNNLLTNAIKFTPPRGTVRVCLSTNEKSVTVTVSDTGEGMTPEVMAHIFEKFYQGDSSHHKSGYGIGLTMAHRAATLCGGSIAVQSTKGQGSTFTVTLPRTEEK
jgi:signal transduction histidine kinase